MSPRRRMEDEKVEEALYKRACGIRYTETTHERTLNKATGEYEVVLTKSVSKYLPPDPTSAVFWLTNRNPEQWRSKREAGEVRRGACEESDLAYLSDEELTDLVRRENAADRRVTSPPEGESGKGEAGGMP